MPAPRACSAADDRSKTVTSHPASRSTSAAVRPPTDPPVTTTRGIIGYGRPNVATLTTSSSNSTGRSSIEGSRSA
jgi:hypothetical protein